MERGLVLDKGHGDTLREQEWLEGEPVRSIWAGLKTKGRDRHPVRTYRCERCGFLESYAIDV
jgi:hypothetical protein